MSAVDTDSGFHRVPMEALDPSLAEFLKPTVERLGYLGSYFAVVGGALPAAVPAFASYTQAVKAPLTDRQNEMLALTVCAALDADYERIQHERLALKLGLDRAWIAAAIAPADAAQSTVLDDTDRALRALALAAIAHPDRKPAAELARIRALLGDRAAIAAVLQIGRFIGIALAVHAFDLDLPVPSIFT